MTDAISPEVIYDAMGAVLTRWTMGSAAAQAAPFWRAELGDDPAEAELRLLALSGQFLGIAVTAEPAMSLRVLPDIPKLALPTLPEALRPLARRILAPKKMAQAELVHFLAARGWTTHPADWMPSGGDDDVPEIYAPWCDWAEIAASGSAARQRPNEVLTADTWDDFWPTMRKAALASLRRRDPAAARAVLEAKLGNENAETRLRLLALLAERLSDDDIAFLEGIAANDRAPKVKTLASSLLARLGRGSAIDAEAAELAGFFPVETKGIFRRTQMIEAERLKTPAQWQRRRALFARADLASFSGALGMTPDALIGCWSWNADPEADTALVGLIVASGTDSEVAQVADLVDGPNATGLLMVLAPRLGPAARAKFAVTALNAQGIRFEPAQAMAGPAARLDDPLSAPAGKTLLAALRRDDAKPADFGGEFHALGLIASREGARRSLERLTAAGLVQGDPRLDMLRLNAALDDRGEKP
ncbi:hypothetical protein JQ543_06185 [Bradyrhizobium diazoefficiens]|nr:DUF5691 domain-containing protein [Bradyrhizobium diazoefficiens]MBR0847326.1 hypothetical protein [Bradyrhizobium diazoefficiens]